MNCFYFSSFSSLSSLLSSSCFGNGRAERGGKGSEGGGEELLPCLEAHAKWKTGKQGGRITSTVEEEEDSERRGEVAHSYVIKA